MNVKRGPKKEEEGGDLRPKIFLPDLRLLFAEFGLDLEASRRAASTSAFVLATSLGLGTDVRSSVRAVDATEVTVDLAATTSTLQQNSLATRGALEGELVKGEHLTAGLLNAGTSRLSDVQSGHGDLGDLQHALVVRHGTYHHKDVILGLTLRVADDLLQRNRRAVVARHHQATQNHLVEVRFRTTGQELVQLHSGQFIA